MTNSEPDPRTPPEFFIPSVPGNKQEDELAVFARRAGCDVPPLDRRPYRITWNHDGQQWTAEVGRQLRGVHITRTSRGRRSRPFTDPAIVLAIFPGNPWRIVTDARPIGRAPSRWANPFLAGVPEKVEYFSAPQ